MMIPASVITTDEQREVRTRSVFILTALEPSTVHGTE